MNDRERERKHRKVLAKQRDVINKCLDLLMLCFVYKCVPSKCKTISVFFFLLASRFSAAVVNELDRSVTATRKSNIFVVDIEIDQQNTTRE